MVVGLRSVLSCPIVSISVPQYRVSKVMQHEHVIQPEQHNTTEEQTLPNLEKVGEFETF